MALVRTPHCVVCGQHTTIEIPDAALELLKQGEHVQITLPEWPASLRELYISGTHSECWDILTKDLEE